MRFYQATAFLFPRSYERRVLLVCLGAAQIPFLTCLALQAMTSEWRAGQLLAVLIASEVGAGLAMAAIHALLKPIAEATSMLRAIQAGRRISAIPQGGDDLVGHLLHGVAMAANEAVADIERTIDTPERDTLTGIRNRDGFFDSAEKILQAEHNGVLAMVEIDHLDLIQDQFGGAAAEDLLITVARRLDEGTRRSDIAARWDENRFAVLLPDTMLDEARLVMERLRTTVALDDGIGAQGWPITFSCGLAPVRAFPQIGEAADQADAALSEATSGDHHHHVLALSD